MANALAEFQQLGDESGVAVVLHRTAVNAIVDNDLVRARQLLDECLALCERNPNAKLVGDAIGKLGWIAQEEGHLERALRLFEESAARSEAAGSPWMAAHSLRSAADLADQLGRTELASEQAREGLRLCRAVGDRQTTVYTLALLARLAQKAGRAEHAGVLWAAIEAEEARGPIGHWEQDRDEIAASVVVHSPEFESGRSTGRSLSLDEAIAYALDQA